MQRRTSRNLSRAVVVAVVLAVGAVAVTTNTRSVAAEMSYFIDQTDAVAAITQPQFAAMVAEAEVTPDGLPVDVTGSPWSQGDELKDATRASHYYFYPGSAFVPPK